MSDREPPSRTIDVRDLQERWLAELEQVARHGARVMVERDGVPVAALISAEDLARLQRLEAERDARFAIIDEIRDAFKDVPDEELEREIPEAVAEARAQLRAERERAAKPA